jgi:hypothetical protein
MNPVATAASQATAQPSDLCDIPEAGQLSPALRKRLQTEDLLDLEVLLRYSGVRTSTCLDSLDTNARAVLQCKACHLYMLLGIVTTHLKGAFNRLYSNSEHFINARSCNRCRHFDSVLVTPASSASSLEPLWVSPEWSSGSPAWSFVGSSRSSSQSGLIGSDVGPVAPGLLPSGGLEQSPLLQAPVCLELPPSADDDTHLKKELARTLQGARQIIGVDCYNSVVQCLRTSDELIMASCAAAAEAVGVLTAKQEDFKKGDTKDLVKQACKHVRDVLVWRSFGQVLGLESRTAVLQCFDDALDASMCRSDNASSQLTNGFRRIKEELVLVLGPGKQPAQRKPTSPCLQDPGPLTRSELFQQTPQLWAPGAGVPSTYPAGEELIPTTAVIPSDDDRELTGSEVLVARHVPSSHHLLSVMIRQIEQRLLSN